MSGNRELVDLLRDIADRLEMAGLVEELEATTEPRRLFAGSPRNGLIRMERPGCRSSKPLKTVGIVLSSIPTPKAPMMQGIRMWKELGEVTRPGYSEAVLLV